MGTTRYDAMNNVLSQPNAHTRGIRNILKKYYPAFDEKVFGGNSLIAQMAEIGMVNYDILKYPICGRCEALAAYIDTARNKDGTFMLKADGSKIGICKCLRCYCKTFDPITFEDWILIELKKKAPNIGEAELRLAVDAIAQKCVENAKQYLNKKIKENAV